jgi:hypothetical protein
MAAVADLEFTQGPNTDVPGRAVVGTLTDGVCNISNGINADIASWEIELLYSPPGSAVAPGVLAAAVSNTPAAAFTPDVSGCFRIRERVLDAFGVQNEDIRNFGIPNFRGIIVPPPQFDPLPIDISLKANELNFGGQAFGWAGDRVVGLFEKYFETYKDVATADVTATPHNAGVNESDLLLIFLDTIAAPTVVNLPAGARDGQLFAVLDAEANAFNFNITVNLPGGDTFPDTTTSRVIFANGGMLVLMKISGTDWVVIKQTSKEEYIPLFGGVDSTDNVAGFDRVCSLPFDASTWPLYSTFVFEAVMETTNVANAHTVRLYNVTDSLVLGTPLSSTSLIPELQFEALTPLNDFPLAAKIYEVQHQMAAGAGPDEVTISRAHLRAVYATSA